MTEIKTIKVYVETGNVNGAATHANIFLGIGGREFNLDTSEDDFADGSKRTYVFGAGSTVVNAEYNNPIEPQLYTEYLNEAPVYVRSDDSGDWPSWQVAALKVTLHTNDSGKPVATYVSRLLEGSDQPIWLGSAYGLRLDLVRVT